MVDTEDISRDVTDAASSTCRLNVVKKTAEANVSLSLNASWMRSSTPNYVNVIRWGERSRRQPASAVTHVVI